MKPNYFYLDISVSVVRDLLRQMLKRQGKNKVL